jgi:hypothetical protein
MNLNKFIQQCWRFMAARRKSWGNKLAFDQLNICEIKVRSDVNEDAPRVETARKVLVLMFFNLSKRGRPTKNAEDIKNVA